MHSAESVKSDYNNFQGVIPKLPRLKPSTANKSKEMPIVTQTVIPSPLLVVTPTVTPVPSPRLIITQSPAHQVSLDQLTLPLCATLHRLGTPKRLSSADNPWMSERTNGPKDIKIIGWTPSGTVTVLPTEVSRPVTPTRRQSAISHTIPSPTLRIINPETGKAKDDSFLQATVFFDHTKPGEPGYDLGSKMRAISSTISQLHSKLQTEYRRMPAAYGIVNLEQFDETLAAYENNQVYFQERLDKKDMIEEEIKRGLTELEHFFMCVIEPRPNNADDIIDWQQREADKVIKRRSTFCDPELYKFITLAPDAIINTIRHYQGQI